MGASLLVFKNKSDIAGAMDEDQVRQALRLDNLHTHKWKIITCSAVTGRNLDEGIAWIVQDARDRLFLY